MAGSELEDLSALNHKLFAAAKGGDLAAVNDCIAAGANVACQDEEGVSSLMTAAEQGHAEVVAALLQEGAPWNQQVSYCCPGWHAQYNRITPSPTHACWP